MPGLSSALAVSWLIFPGAVLKSAAAPPTWVAYPWASVAICGAGPLPATVSGSTTSFQTALGDAWLNTRYPDPVGCCGLVRCATANQRGYTALAACRGM